MREIKFRAWHKEKGMISNPTSMSTIVSRFIREFRHAPTGFGHRAEEVTPEEYTLMQYTGLKDKNGKEIYEGDVVRILYTDWVSCSGCHSSPREHMEEIAHNALVVWSNEDFSSEFCLVSKIGGYEERINPGKYGFIRVIGNIYENPDLLK